MQTENLMFSMDPPLCDPTPIVPGRLQIDASSLETYISLRLGKMPLTSAVKLIGGSIENLVVNVEIAGKRFDGMTLRRAKADAIAIEVEEIELEFRRLADDFLLHLSHIKTLSVQDIYAQHGQRMDAKASTLPFPSVDP